MAGRKASLAEMMGTHASQAGSTNTLKLSNLHEVLGEQMPHLPRNPVGRHRLVTALQQRFGPNFRSLPGVSGLVKEFDDDIEFERKVAHMKSIKPQPRSK